MRPAKSDLPLRESRGGDTVRASRPPHRGRHMLSERRSGAIMADFKTHITTSTVLGAGYGVAGYFYGGLPVETCLLAGGLCSVSGMLPDLDSDSGKPMQEMSAFAAACIPMLMLDRFETWQWSREMI